MTEDLAQYEYAAYHSILKALALSPASWETEEILTSLRMVLHISDEVHADCRGRVNQDPEIVELRDLQKRQSQSMRAGLQQQQQQQPPMHPNAPPGNLVSMHTLESGTGRTGAVAGGHGIQPLMTQNSVSGVNASQSVFGAPLANAPGPRDTLPLATGTAKDSGAGHRGGGGISGAHAWAPPSSARQPSARHASLSDIQVTTGGNKTAKSPAGQKKTLTVSKTSKANARFAQAVPVGLDIMTEDLRGYVLERRPAEGVAWEQCVIVGCRKETTGQRLTVATGFGSAVERYTADVFLRKGKAGVLWRFILPAQRRTGDWDAALARAAAAASAGGVAASVATAGVGGTAAPGTTGGLLSLGGSLTGSVAPNAPPMPGTLGGKGAGKKRKAEVASVAEVPPFTADLRKRAIESARTSSNPSELHAMVSSIQEHRKTLVEQLANLRVQDMLANFCHKDVLSKLRSDLDSVRTKQASLKSGTPTNGRTAPDTAIAAKGPDAPAAAAAAAPPADGASAPAQPAAPPTEAAGAEAGAAPATTADANAAGVVGDQAPAVDATTARATAGAEAAAQPAAVNGDQAAAVAAAAAEAAGTEAAGTEASAEAKQGAGDSDMQDAPAEGTAVVAPAKTTAAATATVTDPVSASAAAPAAAEAAGGDGAADANEAKPSEGEVALAAGGTRDAGEVGAPAEQGNKEETAPSHRSLPPTEAAAEQPGAGGTEAVAKDPDEEMAAAEEGAEGEGAGAVVAAPGGGKGLRGGLAAVEGALDADMEAVDAVDAPADKAEELEHSKGMSQGGGDAEAASDGTRANADDPGPPAAAGGAAQEEVDIENAVDEEMKEVSPDSATGKPAGEAAADEAGGGVVGAVSPAMHAAPATEAAALQPTAEALQPTAEAPQPTAEAAAQPVSEPAVDPSAKSSSEPPRTASPEGGAPAPAGPVDRGASPVTPASSEPPRSVPTGPPAEPPEQPSSDVLPGASERAATAAPENAPAAQEEAKASPSPVTPPSADGASEQEPTAEAATEQK